MKKVLFFFWSVIIAGLIAYSVNSYYRNIQISRDSVLLEKHTMIIEILKESRTSNKGCFEILVDKANELKAEHDKIYQMFKNKK